MVSVAAQISWEGSGKGRVRLRPSHCSSWKWWLCCGWQKQGGDCAYVCLGSPESLRQIGFTRVRREILMGILDVAEDTNILFWILCAYIWRSKAVSSMSCPQEGMADLYSMGLFACLQRVGFSPHKLMGMPLLSEWRIQSHQRCCSWQFLRALLKQEHWPKPLHRLLLAVPGFYLQSRYMWPTDSKWQCCLGEIDTRRKIHSWRSSFSHALEA